MNDNDQANVAPSVTASPELSRQGNCPNPDPFSGGSESFLSVTHFTLVSAALLLFGCYRVSIDAPFFRCGIGPADLQFHLRPVL